MSTPASPFLDHAAPILSAEPAINDQQREQLWDVFHQSKDPNELAQKLVPLAVPDDLKHKLWTAKQAVAPAIPPVDKTVAAMQKMVALDPKVLETAEAHPNVLKVMTSAATTPEKEPAAASSGASGSAKGTKAPKAPAAPQPPRLDGQPHFPSIPDGHHRVLGTDGSVYDIPAESIDQARSADPNMHIMNPEG
jgi:hypothetical protein